ncbi:MAG: phospho-N-acetylmuramoyl-pentapeptide-transferase [bacterium]|nr:phospho-N-acetylmuramoyl-pentapeptide-transferase [bacterium]
MNPVIKILILSTISFAVAIVLTPFWVRFLQRHKLGKQIRTEGAPIFAMLHGKKAGTPTMGGVLVWMSVLIVLGIFTFIAAYNPGSKFAELNFLSRGQTLLPLGAMIISAIIGLGDDLLGIFHIGPKGGGFRLRHRILLYLFVAMGGAWWFWDKLEWDTLAVPFMGTFNIGIWYVPLFILIIFATAFSVNETDGLDGLAGGVLLIAFAALGAIAYAQDRFQLAAFCGVIMGALLAFLWFNIYPAKFFMGDTGSMGLGVTLGVIAMLTNSGLLLPFIAFIPMLESLSVLLQIASKRIRGKKLFLSTPLHHHFEARGWPETQVTMRFWIVGGVAAGLGLILSLLGTRYIF